MIDCPASPVKKTGHISCYPLCLWENSDIKNEQVFSPRSQNQWQRTDTVKQESFLFVYLASLSDQLLVQFRLLIQKYFYLGSWQSPGEYGVMGYCPQFLCKSEHWGIIILVPTLVTFKEISANKGPANGWVQPWPPFPKFQSCLYHSLAALNQENKYGIQVNCSFWIVFSQRFESWRC